MAPPKLSEEHLRRVAETYVECGRNEAATARAFGRTRPTVQHWVLSAKAAGLIDEAPAALPPEAAIPTLRAAKPTMVAPQPTIEATKPRIRVPAGRVSDTSDARVLQIPDAHDSPGLPDKSRFRAIGAYIADYQPDVVVDIGDSLCLDSVSFHTPNDTLGGRLKPSFMADMESYIRAQEALWNEVGKRAPNYRPKKKKCRGNHENRIWRFEDQNPEIAGMMQVEYESILTRFGWDEAPYGVYINVAGVDFVHCPLTKMGKARGGENASTTMARKAVRDLVVGHTHNAQQRCESKDGQDERVRVFETGTALPWGYIIKYAEHLSTGWWWGINTFQIKSGRIEGWGAVPMFELERRHV